MATDDFSGAGFLVGGLVGGELNRQQELENAHNSAARAWGNTNELLDQLQQWRLAGDNFMGAKIRAKADHEGLRSLTESILEAIRKLDSNNQILNDANRDAIAGAAARQADEKHRKTMYSVDIARRKAMLAVVDACLEALKVINPGHPLLKESEQFAIYWHTFKEEVESRSFNSSKIIEHASSRDNLQPGIAQNPRFYNGVADAVKAEQAS